jgi:hypothetical protein
VTAAAEANVTVPPVDPIPPGHRLRGVSSLVAPDGTISAQWIKTQQEHESREALIERLLCELGPRIASRGEPIAPPSGPSRDDVLAVYPMGDPHIGMLAWGVETGADFDLAIAEDLMTRAIRDLVSRGPRSREALLINLGDFYHFDNQAQHTTGGDHTLDVDGRVAKVLVVGLRIIVTMIDALLAHHEHVRVCSKAGNHDSHTSIMLAIALAAHYRHEPRVTIPVDPQHRSYFEFGRCLIGMTHGDKAKGDPLESNMSSEAPEAWGRTRHRYWYCGHVHHSTVRELRGCRIETFRTLAARDSWHAAQGYQSGRDMHRITLHREHGEIGREVASVSWLLDSAARSPHPAEDLRAVHPAPPSMTHGHAPHLDADVSGLDYDDAPDTTATTAKIAPQPRAMSNAEAGLRTGRDESAVRQWRKRRDGATAEDYVRAHGGAV